MRIKPRCGVSYSPSASKTIEYVITDSSAYLMCDDHPERGARELLGPAHAMSFSALSVKVAGQQVELNEQMPGATTFFSPIAPPVIKGHEWRRRLRAARGRLL